MKKYVNILYSCIISFSCVSKTEICAISVRKICHHHLSRRKRDKAQPVWHSWWDSLFHFNMPWTRCLTKSFHKIWVCGCSFHQQDSVKMFYSLVIVMFLSFKILKFRHPPTTYSAFISMAWHWQTQRNW